MTLRDDLQEWFSEARRVVLVGIGNPMRKDDSIGTEIVRGLEGRNLKSVFLINSETVPENFIDQIITLNPTHILIIDAALLKLNPGSVKLTQTIEFSKLAVSTHALPIQIFYEYLDRMTEAKIALLLIQPRDINYGEGLTRELSAVRDQLVNLFSEILASAIN